MCIRDRSNSYKLPAEIIRDNALASSGLLVKKVGGPSVKPYQPDGLWIEKNSFSADLYNYKKNSGDSLYRRGIYTFIKRTSPPPSMIALDATSREVCTVKREKTNTPLQALVLMNDPQFFEASRALAERVQKEGGESISDQIAYGFKLAISRNPRTVSCTYTKSRVGLKSPNLISSKLSKTSNFINANSVMPFNSTALFE